MKIQFWGKIICDKIQYCGNNIYLCISFGYELHLQIWLAIGVGIRYDDGSPIIIWTLSKNIISEDEITKEFQTKLMYDKKHQKQH